MASLDGAALKYRRDREYLLKTDTARISHAHRTDFNFICFVGFTLI